MEGVGRVGGAGAGRAHLWWWAILEWFPAWFGTNVRFSQRFLSFGWSQTLPELFASFFNSRLQLSLHTHRRHTKIDFLKDCCSFENTRSSPKITGNPLQLSVIMSRLPGRGLIAPQKNNPSPRNHCLGPRKSKSTKTNNLKTHGHAEDAPGKNREPSNYLLSILNVR